MKNRIYLFFLLLLCASFSIVASPFRVTQIPNGSKFNCANCHVNPNGGGARNKFGQLVEVNLDNQGNVKWSAAMATADSDGDGQSNGKELQDPTGAWRTNQPNPGDFSKVSNPGDMNSTDIKSTELPAIYALMNNYPNPFNPSTQIQFQIPQAGFVSLVVYDVLGKEIATLVNEFKQPGNYSTLFAIGSSYSSGVYFYRLTSNNFSSVKKMIYQK